MENLKEVSNENALVDKQIEEHIDNVDLNDIDMSCEFRNSKFNRDISKWTVSDVKHLKIYY